MNSKFFLAFILVTIVLTFGPLAARAATTVDTTDINLVRDNARIANDKVMNAQTLTRGIVCETGACFKDAHPGQGFEQEPIIEPADAAASATESKSGTGKTKK